MTDIISIHLTLRKRKKKYILRYFLICFSAENRSSDSDSPGSKSASSTEVIRTHRDAPVIPKVLLPTVTVTVNKRLLIYFEVLCVYVIADSHASTPHPERSTSTHSKFSRHQTICYASYIHLNQ